MKTGLVRLDDDTGDYERCASQFEEVVCCSHLVHLQDVGKDVAESTLCVVQGCLVCRGDSQLWLGQRLHVGLSVRGHRHLFQLQVGCRHHVLGEMLRDFRFQHIGRDFTFGSVVCAEMLLAVDFSNENHHFLHSLHFQHHILNLSKFDTQAAQLDLVVGSSENHHISVGQPFCIVARLVDALTVIVDEPFACHLVQVVVTSCNTFPSYI